MFPQMTILAFRFPEGDLIVGTIFAGATSIRS
jgi:hypothetical protein